MEQSSGGISPGVIGAAGARPQVATGCLYLFALPFLRLRIVDLEHVLWNDEHAASSDGATVPVAFFIAPDTPASDYANSRNEIIWRLGASGPTSAGKFDAQFEVPVFKVAETAEQQRLAEAVRTSEHQQVESYVHPEASRITMRQMPGGATEVYFPPLRNPGAALATATFTGLWTSFFWLIHMMHVPWFFVAGWGFFDVILVLIC